jgi:hypothetical protein
LFQSSPADVLASRVMMTLVDGAVAFERPRAAR